MVQQWLDRLFPPTEPAAKRRGAQLPSTVFSGFMPSLDGGKTAANEQLPNASLIYGVAAAAFFGIALYFLFTGMWLTGLLMFIPASALLGYALHFLRYPV